MTPTAAEVKELVERLEDAEIGYRPHVVGKMLGSAAVALTALQSRIEELERQIAAKDEALRPFASIAAEFSEQEDEDFQVWEDFDHLTSNLPLSIFRRAARALGGSNG